MAPGSVHLTATHQAEYDRLFLDRVLALPSLAVTDVVNQRRPELREVQVTYSTHKEFEANAKKMKIMFDFRVSG